ncbi:MAG TPA: Gfo/Idh/MocA family oxidoreductase, partial [Fimbriimonadaceae bacterium]|nr:Gfo/Idh/MocA family oxidoreductase [Fimbriimonadaceae bacterium]
MSEPTIDRRSLLKAAAATGMSVALGQSAQAAGSESQQARKPKGKSVAGLAAPKMDKVRVGFVGVGARGSGHVAQMLLLEGVEVTAICDTHRPSLDKAVKRCVDKGRPAPKAYDGAKDYLRLANQPDVDIVIISTPWSLHVPMAVAAMRAGKHAFIEVPAATTVDGCWELVDTAEETQRHCMMM